MPLFQRLRMFVTLGIRLIAVVLMLVGVYGFVQAALAFIWYGTVNISYDLGFTWIGYGLGYTVSGLALAVSSGRLVRWLVPLARHECPQCGYAMRNLTTNRCPECGWELTDVGSADHPAPSVGNPREPAR